MPTDFDNAASPQDLYGPALLIEDAGPAGAYLERLVARAQRVQGLSVDEALDQERTNLGYFAGNASHETRKRVERLFGAVHPLLGSAMREPVTAEEALAVGLAAGRARQGHPLH